MRNSEAVWELGARFYSYPLADQVSRSNANETWPIQATAFEGATSFGAKVVQFSAAHVHALLARTVDTSAASVMQMWTCMILQKVA